MPEQKPAYRAATEDGDQQAARSLGPEHELIAAAIRGDVVDLRRLLDRGVAVDTIVSGRFNWTPLMYAAWKGHLETVRELLDRGAAVNHACRDFFTALTLAAGEGQWEVVRLLSERGGDVTHTDSSGNSALGCARKSAPADLVACLESCV